jgi:hypothetical protein
MSSRGNSIGCEPRLIKRRSQDRIPHLPTLVWTCQKKKKKKMNLIKLLWVLLGGLAKPDNTDNDSLNFKLN